MPEPRPIVPPMRLPVAEYKTPSPTVVFYTEFVSREDPAYFQNAPVKRGTLYSSMVGANQQVIDAYPNLYFLGERKFRLDDTLVFWDWANIPEAEDTYNAEIEYVAQSVDHPAFTRVYTLLREVYDANPTIVEGQTLTGLLGVSVVNGGQDYTYATGTIEGTDVEIQFVVSKGVIVSGVVTNEGVGVLSSSIIIVTGDGQGAVVTPIVQGTNCYLISQKKQELPQDDPLKNEFVRVIRVYETLPGPIITETSIDKNGDITTITRQRVVASTLLTTNVIFAGVWTRTYQVPVENNYFVATKTVEVRNTQNSLDSYQVEIPDLLPEEFRPGAPVTTHEDTVIGTASLPTLAVGDLMRSESQIDDYTYRRIIRGRASISLPQTITNKETVSEFGGGIVSRTLVLDLFNNLLTTPPFDGSLMILSNNIRHIDDILNGLSVKTTRQLDAASWPILYATHVDEKYDLVIDIQRQTVAAGTTGGVLGDGTIVEVKSHDKWKSIQFSSKFDASSLPEDTQWFGSMNRSFPPELVVNPWVEPVIDWAEATCGCSDSFSATLVANFNQYNGIVKTRITEQFYDGVPPDDVTITQFFPQAHSFGFAWSSFCGDTDGNCRTKSGAPKFYIPLCLHDDFTVCIGHPALFCVDAFPDRVWTFPATTPAALPHGSYIMLAPHVERWRFGVFRRVLTEVLVP